MVFTAPFSYEHFKIADSYPEHREYLKILTKLFGKVYNFQHESIKDYSTYHEFRSSAHMTRLFSAKILERIFTGMPRELGEVLQWKN